MFDIGSFLGAVLTGYLSDRLGKRNIVMYPMLLLAGLLCFIVKWFLTDQAGSYYVVIFAIGVFLGGPYCIISSVVSIDIAS
jgi:sugar phosphate permease